MATVQRIDTDRRVTFTDGRATYLGSMEWSDVQKLAEAMGANRGLPNRGRPSKDALVELIARYLDENGSWERKSDSIPMPATPNVYCPKCNHDMVKRYSAKTRSDFWGCSRFPACTGTRPISYKPDTQPPTPSDTDHTYTEPTEYPYSVYCSDPTHPSIIIHTEADKAFAVTCAVCGTELSRTAPTIGPSFDPADNAYVQELEAEVISLTERAESAELQIKTMLPVPNIDGDKIAHGMLQRVISAVGAIKRGAVFLVGPPGTGKSHMAQDVADALELELEPFSCDPGMTRSTLFGYPDANGVYRETGLRRRVENGGVFLLDEIDNGNPSLIAALNSLISNGAVSFPDRVVTKHPDFKLIATGNTFGIGPNAQFTGRLGLDPASLDRMTRIEIGIDEQLEAYVTRTLIHEEIAEQILEAVRTIRMRAAQRELRIIVSPRMAYSVAELMHTGEWTMAEALQTTALATVDPGTVAQLLSGIKGLS